MINYWWVTRPKRKLDSIPQVLALFAKQAIDQVWNGQRTSHLSIEEALYKKRRDDKNSSRQDRMGNIRQTALIFQCCYYDTYKYFLSRKKVKLCNNTLQYVFK